MAEIKRRTPPCIAVRTPALHDLVFGDVNRRRWRELNHLATVVQTLTRQVIRTHGALIQKMPLDTGWRLTTTRRVVLLVALPPLAVRCVSLGAIGLHERR